MYKLAYFFSETDEEGDIDDDHAIDWSDEENENIDDNNEIYKND